MVSYWPLVSPIRIVLWHQNHAASISEYRSENVQFFYHHICTISSLRWRHNGLDGVSNHQPHHCLLSRIFGRRSKKTSKLRVTGLSARNSPGTGEFPAQMAGNAENVSIWWRHHVKARSIISTRKRTWRPVYIEWTGISFLKSNVIDHTRWRSDLKLVCSNYVGFVYLCNSTQANWKPDGLKSDILKQVSLVNAVISSYTCMHLFDRTTFRVINCMNMLIRL